MNHHPHHLLLKIRTLLALFAAGLILSGLTAFPVETLLNFASGWIHYFPELIQLWYTKIHFAVLTTNRAFPFLSYGTDWLAFAHLVIAVAFWGPWKDPVRNIWVIQFGLIACVAIFPLAFIAGSVRGIPLFWQLIDCSFGIVGSVPLLMAYRLTRQLEKQSPYTYEKN